MTKAPGATTDIDVYISRFPEDLAGRLQRLRDEIRKLAHGATETIKYGIPTYVLHENLIHFGGFKTHVGLYPGPQAIEHFAADLGSFPTSRGAIQFPMDRPLPLTLIRRIVKHRLAEVRKKYASR